VRKKSLAEYRKVRRELDKVREAVERFDSHDLPAFKRWMHATFGKELTELRELAAEADRFSDLLDKIDDMVCDFDISCGEAYLVLTETPERVPATENAEPKPQPEGGSDEADAQEEDFDEFDPDEHAAREAFEDFKKIFEAFTGEKFRGDFPRGPRDKPPRREPPRLKELYRILVRKLHPDTRSAGSARATEWWHEVQEAYEAGDVARLEVILTLCESEDGEPGEGTSVSMLQQIIRHTKASLREVKGRASRLRRDPAWGFSKCGDRAGWEERFRALMKRDLDAGRRDVADARNELDAIKAEAEEFRALMNSPKKKRAHKPRSRPHDQAQFPF
jgi:hypothetical protein